jgi:hypothetical protein
MRPKTTYEDWCHLCCESVGGPQVRERIREPEAN